MSVALCLREEFLFIIMNRRENYKKKFRLHSEVNSLKLWLRLSGERSITAVRRCLSEEFLQINNETEGGKFSEEFPNS